MIHPCPFLVRDSRMHGLPANSLYVLVKQLKSQEPLVKSDDLAVVTDLILLYLANNTIIINLMARYF
jgi:hypothetical protein